jgi:hypothetical protein
MSELQEKIADEVQVIINASETRARAANDQNAIYSAFRAEQQKQLDNLISLAAMGEEMPEAVYKRISQVQLAIHDFDLKIAMNDISNQIECVDYKGMKHQERKEILKTLVRKIELFRCGSYDITWKNHVGQKAVGQGFI